MNKSNLQGLLTVLFLFVLGFVYFCSHSKKDDAESTPKTNYEKIVDEEKQINRSAPIKLSDGMTIVSASYDNKRFFTRISVSNDSLFQNIANNKDGVRESFLKSIRSSKGRELELNKILVDEGSSKVYVFYNATNNKYVEINLYHRDLEIAISSEEQEANLPSQ